MSPWRVLALLLGRKWEGQGSWLGSRRVWKGGAATATGAGSRRSDRGEDRSPSETAAMESAGARMVGWTGGEVARMSAYLAAGLGQQAKKSEHGQSGTDGRSGWDRILRPRAD